MNIWTALVVIFTMIGGWVGGILTERWSGEKEIITSEIHLTIPKDEKELRKQILHVHAQKSILDQLERWEKEKEKEVKKK